ncbi:hypothetical protein GQ607_013914 [Colletotrichum asianum]|uniref:Uncharacterized protein n=1 Tax=Colletotrichum asianum TaxID=702518 RepID=A0A8H3W5X1_9PEZI|nr:hypothetical protein GQ607_013914 [Colletotrichum asianum]
MWSADHAGGCYDPLNSVEGCLMASMGRMVNSPEEAACINFQSSPASADFLWGPLESIDPHKFIFSPAQR